MSRSQSDGAIVIHDHDVHNAIRRNQAVATLGRCVTAERIEPGGMPVHFTVGLRRNGKAEHIVVDADDALIAALKAKLKEPDAAITYVRPQNRRGDARHPALQPRGSVR